MLTVHRNLEELRHHLNGLVHEMRDTNQSIFYLNRAARQICEQLTCMKEHHEDFHEGLEHVRPCDHLIQDTCDKLSYAQSEFAELILLLRKMEGVLDGAATEKDGQSAE